MGRCARWWRHGAVASAQAELLAPWGVSVLFWRGAFTAENTAAAAHVLRWGLLQLPLLAC